MKKSMQLQKPKISKKRAAVAVEDVPFLAIDAFRRFPSPLAWLAGPPAGKRKKALAIAEEPFRKSHVAIERLRQTPSPAALLGLLRNHLPGLKVSPVQSTVYLAWAEVLLRECRDEERFDVLDMEMDRIALAAVFLQAAAALRSAPPFSWIHLYLESLLASASPEGSPSDAVHRAAAALKAAAAAGEPQSVRTALTRVVDAARERTRKPRRSARPHLILRKGDQCLLVDGTAISLTPREFTLLWTTAEGGTLSRKRGVELLQKIPSQSGAGIDGAVEEEALRAHRRSILAKVEKRVGREFRDLLGKAFHTEKRLFIYDEAVLPFSVE